MSLRHYALRSIVLNFAGIDITEGAGEDEFLTIQEPEDYFTTTIGADGTATRNDMPVGMMKAALTLMATSPTNDKLSLIHEADRLQRGGAGVGPFFMQNLLGTDTVVSSEAFIRKRPDRAFAKKVGTRVWGFDIIDPENFSGS